LTNPVTIRILERDNNSRGDLFGRLVSDIFLSLGYDNVRLKVARSGREIDVIAEHRFENRSAIAECKAVEEKIGGAHLNTFAGKLRTEARRAEAGRSVSAYFISLSGFTETAIDQEREAGEDRVILVKGEQAVHELVKGRILVPYEQASASAANLASAAGGLEPDENPELLAHRIGWIWVIYYATGKQRTHFVLVHADGTILSAAIACDVITADQQVRGPLYKLSCLNPEAQAGFEADEAAARNRYYQYLAQECGYFLLDGLPADAQVGSRRLPLENLFVPLHLATGESEEEMQREEAGRVLQQHSRIAILASPGGGKSTLIKRLAVAYSDPQRRMLSQDHLPHRSWIPLFFRCRELREHTRAPFPDLITALTGRAVLAEFAPAFRRLVDRALRNGEVLLLVDGLDEISNTGDRTAFVHNLRTFLAIYPNVSLVVTSREAGFRHVAGLLASICREVKLADFDDDDIRSLSVAWHKEVLGSRPEIISDSERLAATISTNDRIRRLAVNPLMLTTLLLVKRWVGQLPTRRTVLYGKAVEVLLMTWNVEGHEPIDQDEALPQLCYVAFAMMQQGAQKISRTRLTMLLREAREELAAELAYARVSVAEFIDRIEHRSSVLMMTGHEIENGTLVEIYEFRHLTFQEYLTAKAIIHGWYPGRQDSDTPEGLLQPRFEDERWREVIPLTAVLAGRRAETLVQALTRHVRIEHRLESRRRSSVAALGMCIADEVQLVPDTAADAIDTIIKLRDRVPLREVERIVSGKFRDLFRERARAAYFERHELAGGCVALHRLNSLATRRDEVDSYEEVFDSLTSKMSGNIIERCEAAIGIMSAAFWLARKTESERRKGALLPEHVRNSVCASANAVVNLIFSDDRAQQYAASWALAWIGSLRVWTPRRNSNTMQQLFSLWRTFDNPELRRMASYTFV
jgi:hypothetical protein